MAIFTIASAIGMYWLTRNTIAAFIISSFSLSLFAFLFVLPTVGFFNSLLVAFVIILLMTSFFWISVEVFPKLRVHLHNERYGFPEE